MFFPLIEAMGERLKEETVVRPGRYQPASEAAMEHLRRNLDSLKEHLVKRRQWLLDQPEIKAAGKFDRAELTK